MSVRDWDVDERSARTIIFLLRCPGLSVHEAMRACKSSMEESVHPAKQMVVCRSFAKTSGVKAIAPPPTVVNALTVGATTVSPLTNPTTAVGTPMTPRTQPMTLTSTMRPKPKQKLMRKSTVRMQKFRINNLEASDHAKRALKSNEVVRASDG